VDVSPELASLLRTALPEVAVVEKTRRLFLRENVRIHLDTVDGLGSFVELEAVAVPGSDLTAEREAVDQLRRALEIVDDDLLGESYAELVGRGARTCR
jgi:predicted adenylyl cyclase CyaB